MKKGSRLPLVMVGVLIALMLIGGIALGGKSKKKPASGAKPAAAAKPAAQKAKTPQSPFASAAKGGRSALVQTASGQRTVVVPPCDTPVDATVANAAHGTPTPGATVLQIPKARTPHMVVVPACAGSTGETQTPSAAIVSTVNGATPAGLKSQLTVSDSDAKTIVLPPCAKQASSGATTKRSGVLVAPAC